MTNEEIIAVLGLPNSVITALQDDSVDTTTYQANMNQFLNNVVNKIAYQRIYAMKSFKNPFGRFKSYPVEWGDTIENLYVELPTGYKYNKDATDPFTKSNPSVKAFYNQINSEMQYCVTIQRDLMRRAFLRANGLQSIIDVIIKQLTVAMEIDEYKSQLTVLNNANAFANGFETFNADQYSTAEDAAQALTLKIADLVDDMTVAPSTAHNKAGVETISNKEDLILVIKPEIMQRINFEYLTGVFNLSKVELVNNIIKVPTFMTGDTTNTQTVGQDVDFMLLDKDIFENHQVLRDGGAIYNPKGRYVNHFTDNWNLFGLKTFVNAHAFKITDTNKYLHK